jgi:uncharacterized RDD family membrane protein YckC
MNNAYVNPTEANDMLSEFEVNLVPASAGKRFANYLIDFIVVFCLLVLVLFIFFMATGSLGDSSREDEFASFVVTIVYSLLFGVFYGLIEGIFKGKTLGKVVTGTLAVNADGTRINFKTAFLRGFSRIVPFEAFSAFGSPSYPWHDKWTNTLVVNEKESSLPETKSS